MSSEEENKSEYPELTPPDVNAHIPDHLMEKLTPEMRYLIEQNSIQSQNMQWVINAMIDTNKQVRRTNGRLKRVENWKSKLTNYGTIMAVIFVIVSSLAGGAYKLFEILILN